MRIRCSPLGVIIVLGFTACSSAESTPLTPDAGAVGDAGDPPDTGVGPRTDAAADSSALDADDADAAHADAAAGCVLEETSTLPHVRFAFQSTACTFTLAQAAGGIVFAYDVIVDQDVPGFAPATEYTYGPTENAGNLVIDEVVSGTADRYCVCDRGRPVPRCPDGTAQQQGVPCAPITLRAGTYHRTFTWDGRNWNGPSDTSNPEGAPFPPGDYEFALRTLAGSVGDAGPATLAATGRFAVHLVR